jgi:hypothetical protein
MSGLGSTAWDYAASCPGATIGEGLAVQGQEVADAEPAVQLRLQRVGLSAGLTALGRRSAEAMPQQRTTGPPSVRVTDGEANATGSDPPSPWSCRPKGTRRSPVPAP